MKLCAFITISSLGVVCHASDTATPVFCPPGWQVAGPLCVTIFDAPPYTECPSNKNTFRAISPSMGGMWVVENGVCAHLYVLSPDIVCPEGYDIHYTTDSEPGAILQCVPVDTVPVDTDNDHPMPDTECPEGYDTEVLKLSMYVWRDKSSLRCVRLQRLEGQIWCPDNFSPYGHGYVKKMVETSNHHDDVDGHATHDNDHDNPDLSHDLHSNATSAHSRVLASSGGDHGDDNDHHDGVPWYEEHPELVTEDPFLSTLPEWLLPKLNSPSGCAQVMAIDARECSEFRCNSKYISDQKDIIELWIHNKLGFLDEDLLMFDSVPTGNDLRWTVSEHSMKHGSGH